MDPIKSIAFVFNHQKTGAPELLNQLVNKSQELGVSSKTTCDYPIPPEFLKDVDACCVIGGDGTLLSTVPQAIEYNTPVFGFNRGKLGFLATFNPHNATETLEAILKGKYKLAPRRTLHCTGSEGSHFYALNDIVIKNARQAHLMEISVKCNEEYVTTYRADGILFCTATGSTAYNLSAGGPIMYPGINAFAMTPICPHTLTNRTVLFDAKSVLAINVDLPDNAIVAVDGNDTLSPEIHFPLQISLGEKTLTLIQSPSYSHFNTLRTKLNWGD